MNISSNTIYLNESNSIEIKKSLFNTKIIILGENLFIKIVPINKDGKIDQLLEENIKNTLYKVDILVHYEILKYNKEKYMIIYFVKYYNKLKDFISKGTNIKIYPYQLLCDTGKRNSGINIIVNKYKEKIYLTIKIKGIVIYGECLDDKLNEALILQSINRCHDKINIKNIDNKILHIDECLYYDNLKTLFEEIRIIKKKVKNKCI